MRVGVGLRRPMGRDNKVRVMIRDLDLDGPYRLEVTVLSCKPSYCILDFPVLLDGSLCQAHDILSRVVPRRSSLGWCKIGHIGVCRRSEREYGLCSG